MALGVPDPVENFFCRIRQFFLDAGSKRGPPSVESGNLRILKALQLDEITYENQYFRRIEAPTRMNRGLHQKNHLTECVSWAKYRAVTKTG
jgi:hypothetical protein